MTDRNRQNDAEEARRNQREVEKQRRQRAGLPDETDIERQEREGREEREGKAMSGAPANKDAAGKRSAKSEEKPDGEESEIEGHVSVMEEEMLAAANTKDAPEKQEPQPRTIHVMEKQMKGEAIQDAAEGADRPDNTLPEEPLPGKPPEPPLGGSSRVAEPERRGGPGKRR